MGEINVGPVLPVGGAEGGSEGRRPKERLPAIGARLRGKPSGVVVNLEGCKRVKGEIPKER